MIGQLPTHSDVWGYFPDGTIFRTVSHDGVVTDVPYSPGYQVFNDYFWVDRDGTLRKAIADPRGRLADLNFELTAVFHFSVDRGRGNPADPYPIFGSQEFISGTVVVRDVNERPRIFGNPGASASLFAAVGTVLGHYDSSDEDLTPGWGVPSHRFSISGDVTGLAIDETTGTLRVAGSLVDDPRSERRITVRVTDGGGLSAETPVTLDLSNYAPTFGTARSFPVTGGPGSLVGTVTATDPDLSRGDRLTYEIISGGDGLFTIDGDTGAIRVGGESIPFGTYRLTVRATDRGGKTTETYADISNAPGVGEMSGFGVEGGLLNFEADLYLPPAGSTDDLLMEVDIDRDGTYDVSAPYDADLGGFLVSDVDEADKLTDFPDGSSEATGYYLVLARFAGGNWSTAYSFYIRIENAAPEITVAEPGPAIAFKPYTLSVTATDPGGDPVESVTIDWGDGTTETFPGDGGPSFTRSFTHTYRDHGDHTVLIYASDGRDEGHEAVYLRVDGSAKPRLLLGRRGRLRAAEGHVELAL